ncbi:MAG: enoyl-CoA hydratase/isomerase family protein [Alcaligenaceae bacterium]
MLTLSQIKYDVIGHVAVVSLNYPPVNAFSKTLSDDLTAILDFISETDEVRAVVLTGEGKIFCAGADLKGRANVIKGPGDMPAHMRRSRECFHAIRECTKPVVVALNGPALGAGLAIAASGDILIASEKGSLGLPEIDVGLLGGGSHAARLFPHSMLRQMMLTGYRVPASELYRLGVVTQVTTPEQLMPAALELANNIASKSPLSVRLAKQTLNAIEDMSLRDGYRYEQDMTAAIANTADAKEAQKAFLEKRPAVFVGR